MSKKIMRKGHFTDHASQQSGIESTEHGMVSKETKKQFDHRRRADENIVTTTKATYTMDGVAGSDFERYKTNYNSFENQDPTSRDQLTFAKRQGTRRVVHDPAMSKQSVHFNMNESMRDNMASSHMIAAGSSSMSISNAAPYAVPRKINPGKSMISNLGESLARNILDEMPKATVANEMDPRSMLMSNYRPLPGYTGTKHY